MNEMQKAIENTRIIRDAIEAANFRRHEAEVSQVGNDLVVSVSGIADDTVTHGTTVKELLRLCRVCKLTFEDGVRGESINHGGAFASIWIKGVSLADVVARLAVEESEDDE